MSGEPIKDITAGPGVVSPAPEQTIDHTDPSALLRRVETGLARRPGDTALLRLRLLAQISLDDRPAARSTEAELAEKPLDSETFEVLVAAALTQDRVAAARDLVARAMHDTAIAGAAQARAKARIALHVGDAEAAKAILVAAIEADPGAAGLRPLMTETLLASGGAAYARDILSFLGKAPVNPDPASISSDREAPSTAPRPREA